MRGLLQLVSVDDVLAVGRFGDDAFVACAEEALRGSGGELARCVSDGLRIEDAGALEQQEFDDRCAEIERAALFRLRHLPRCRRTARSRLRLVPSGATP